MYTATISNWIGQGNKLLVDRHMGKCNKLLLQ